MWNYIFIDLEVIEDEVKFSIAFNYEGRQHATVHAILVLTEITGIFILYYNYTVSQSAAYPHCYFEFTLKFKFRC